MGDSLISKDNRYKLVFRWSLASAAAIALFWAGWYLIQGSVPVVTELRFSEKFVYHLPVVMSRWWDVLLGPIYSMAVIYIITANHDVKEVYGLALGSGLLYGLMFGFVLGVIFGFGYKLNFGLTGGLIFGIGYGLVVGLVLGISYGLIFTFLWGLGNRIAYGLGYGLLYCLILGLASGIVVGVSSGLVLSIIFALGVSIKHIVDWFWPVNKNQLQI
jgi:hypothetical protein